MIAALLLVLGALHPRESVALSSPTWKAELSPKSSLGGQVRFPSLDPSKALFDGLRGVSKTEFPVPTDSISAYKGRSRLLKERAYARSEPFDNENLSKPPTLEDLAPPSAKPMERFLVSRPEFWLVFVVGTALFPQVVHGLESVVMLPDQVEQLLSTFSPGVAILYGSFASLTISTLYNRQRAIQENCAIECALLTVMMRNILSLFRGDTDLLKEGGQCIADQVSTLVRASRGEELMCLMYNDPYARLSELVNDFEEEQYDKNPDCAARFGSLTTACRDTVTELSRHRARRLSDETLAIPPTHFFILNVLTCMSLLSYSLSAVGTAPLMGDPPLESSLMFGCLASTYVLFYNFARDLSEPFRGNYQIRRSGAASALLEIKWTMANHPILRGFVHFEKPDFAAQVGKQNEKKDVGHFAVDLPAHHQAWRAKLNSLP